MTRIGAGSSSWLRRGIAAALAIPACYAAYSFGILLGPAKPSVESAAALPATQLTCGLDADPSQLDLGEVWEDPQFVQPVTITNRGDREQRITNLDDHFASPLPVGWTVIRLSG